VNDIDYNMPMPEKPELTILEIAEISTYIFNKWGEHNGLISTEEVSKALESCDLVP